MDNTKQIENSELPNCKPIKNWSHKLVYTTIQTAKVFELVYIPGNEEKYKMFDTVMKLPNNLWWILGSDTGKMADGGAGTNPKPLYMIHNKRKYGEFILKDWMNNLKIDFLWDPTFEQRVSIANQLILAKNEYLKKIPIGYKTHSVIFIDKIAIGWDYLPGEWDIDEDEELFMKNVKRILDSNYVIKQSEELFWPVPRIDLRERLITNPEKPYDQPIAEVLPSELTVLSLKSN